MHYFLWFFTVVALFWQLFSYRLSIQELSEKNYSFWALIKITQAAIWGSLLLAHIRMILPQEVLCISTVG